VPIEEILTPDAHEDTTVIEEGLSQDKERTRYSCLLGNKFFMVVVCDHSYCVSFSLLFIGCLEQPLDKIPYVNLKPIVALLILMTLFLSCHALYLYWNCLDP